MGINLSNFLSSKSKNARMIDFQDLDHVDGMSISVISANLYNDNRDDLSCSILEKEQIMLQFTHSQK